MSKAETCGNSFIASGSVGTGKDVFTNTQTTLATLTAIDPHSLSPKEVACLHRAEYELNSGHPDTAAKYLAYVGNHATEHGAIAQTRGGVQGNVSISIEDERSTGSYHVRAEARAVNSGRDTRSYTAASSKPETIDRFQQALVHAQAQQASTIVTHPVRPGLLGVWDRITRGNKLVDRDFRTTAELAAELDRRNSQNNAQRRLKLHLEAAAQYDGPIGELPNIEVYHQTLQDIRAADYQAESTFRSIAAETMSVMRGCADNANHSADGGIVHTIGGHRV